METEKYLSKYFEMISKQNFDGNDIDYSGMERHISLLKQIAVLENSSLTVLDLYKKSYIFMHSKFTPDWGLSAEEIIEQGPGAILSMMHTEDLPFVIETGILANKFFMDLPIDQRKDYKAVYDFRLRCIDGKYRHYIQQLLPLELDRKGNIWLMLIMNDSLPGKDKNVRHQRRMINVINGKVFSFDKDVQAAGGILSKRELEILGMLAKGHSSKKVADELFISINTVNNHRRNILEKTNSGNTAEAVKYAISLGLM